MDSVDMATRSTRRDDWVDATVENWYGTWQSPKCVGSRDKEEPCSENRPNHRVVVTKGAESERVRDESTCGLLETRGSP
jgi:hypothetical protein